MRPVWAVLFLEALRSSCFIHLWVAAWSPDRRRAESSGPLTFGLTPIPLPEPGQPSQRPGSCFQAAKKSKCNYGFPDTLAVFIAPSLCGPSGVNQTPLPPSSQASLCGPSPCRSFVSSTQAARLAADCPHDTVTRSQTCTLFISGNKMNSCG